MMKKAPEPIGKCARYECKHHDKGADEKPCMFCTCNVLRTTPCKSFCFAEEKKEGVENNDT